jgi:hypothetical protein
MVGTGAPTSLKHPVVVRLSTPKLVILYEIPTERFEVGRVSPSYELFSCKRMEVSGLLL